MIFKGSSDLSPKVTIRIDNVPVDYLSIVRVTVELKENMHNMVILEFAGLNPQLISEYIDRPIQLSIEMRERDPFEFCGYITFLEPVSKSYDGTVNSSPFQITRAYCLSASYLMKSTTSRVWENITLSEIATELADKYLFSVSVPNDTYRFTRLVQTAQSDWSFLVDSANQLGYSVSVENTHIHIWDPYKAIARKRAYSALYTLRGLLGTPSASPGQIMKFDGRIGGVTPDGNKNADTIYLLDNSGKMLSASNADSDETSGLGKPIETLLTNTLNTNAISYEMGNKLVSAELRKKFPMTAQVDVVGDTSIQPGGVVSIKEYNSQFDGFWYVNNVHHELFQSTISTSLEISKDSLGASEVGPTMVASYSTPPAPALRNGRWVSETDMVHVYA
jgi:hypothetical protein